MAAKREFATYAREVVKAKDGRVVKEMATSTVRVMARAEGYAMVRQPNAASFVVSEKELRP